LSGHLTPRESQRARAISSSGPSQHSCDMGAIAFRSALTIREARKQARHQPNGSD